MFDSIPARITAAVLIVIIGIIGVAVVLLYTGGGSKSSITSGTQESEYRKIITYEQIYTADTGKTTYNMTYARIDNIDPGKPIHFLSPFGKTMSELESQASDSANGFNTNTMTNEQKSALIGEADAFEQYVLVRLPPVLGGHNNSIDAIRAYSLLDPASKCLLQYWPNPQGEGIVLRDVCHDDVFRISDGYSCYGKLLGGNPVVAAYNAIPRMRLSVDNQGILLVAKPDGQPSGDGTVGEGRIMPAEEIKHFEDDPSCAYILNHGSAF